MALAGLVFNTSFSKPDCGYKIVKGNQGEE